jgi:putative (di)nucleoside polyphosphate hydrolase
MTSLYRPCVGICLINKDGLVFAAERHNFRGAWQMPQGGVDDGEDIITAARRELFEETNVKNAEIVAQMPKTIKYDLPPELSSTLWGGKYRGQEQTWFAMKFTGDDSEINITAHEPIEFTQWKWVEINTLPDLIVPFKREVYARVIAAFKPLTLHP